MATTTNLLQHPTHDHPLVPLDSTDDSIEDPLCHLCGWNISSEAYTCQEKCEPYIYHRVCAEAPPQIYPHPLHPHHPLTLSHRQSFLDCHACGEFFNSLFRCEECEFRLDVGCALSTLSDRGGSPGGTTPEQIDLPLHPHTLTSFSTRHDFVGVSDCVICKASVEGDGYMCLHRDCKFLIHMRCIQDLCYTDGTKAPRIYHRHPLMTFLGEDMGLITCASCRSDASLGEFIGCASCEVFIHRDCIQVPEIVRYPHHPNHTLVLLINSTDNDKLQCDSCSFHLEGELCYGCPSCEFFAQVECALQTLAYCGKGMSAEIKLSWHEHPLLLCHGIRYSLGCCSYCEDESAGPMYVCKEEGCEFLLHKRCTEIKLTIIHPHHPDHSLTLRQATYYERCESCCETIRHLYFYCELCAFYLHAKCAARFPTRKHYLHEHELLCLEWVPSLDCNRCGASTNSPFLRCVLCDFNLHEKCTEVPRVVKSEVHWHPLTLHESYIEDDSGEYYCDHCEKRRDDRLAAYVCGQCTARWAYHIECALPELQKMYAKKDNTVAIEIFAKEIARREEEIHATERKLDEMRHNVNELRKKHAALILE